MKREAIKITVQIQKKNPQKFNEHMRASLDLDVNFDKSNQNPVNIHF